MKILVLQLARLGDIYMTWPMLRALRRAHPTARIEVLTRPRFSQAFEGLSAIDEVKTVPTKEILAPLVQLNMDVKSAYEGLSQYVETLRNENYDWIINLSFSPFSSYLTHAISHVSTKVCGYTRHADGFLSMPDDTSAFFYAQVGVGRPNRFHLVEIFATMAGLDLLKEDWQGPSPMPALSREIPDEYMVIHVGASEAQKSLSAAKWIAIISHLYKIRPIAVVLVGASQEQELAAAIEAGVPGSGIINLVGKTSLTELFPLIKKASLFVGCDSAPLHMASLVATPCVNISVGRVNFWETGPRALGSYVIRAAKEDGLEPEKIAVVIARTLSGDKQDLGVIPVLEGTPSYWALTSRSLEFDWAMIKAIYQGADFPLSEDPIFRDGIQKLNEINTLMVDQIEAAQRGLDLQKVAPIIERGEDVIETIGKLVPGLVVLIRWYQTEKIRIGPDSQEKLLAKTVETQRLLQKVIDLYQSSFLSPEKEMV